MPIAINQAFTRIGEPARAVQAGTPMTARGDDAPRQDPFSRRGV